MTQEQKNDLEALVDSTSLSAVLEALADICDAKAEHLVANWQAKEIAKQWTRAGRQIASAASKIGGTL